MTTSEAVRAFRESHSDLETWGAVDFEVYEHLVLIELVSKEGSNAAGDQATDRFTGAREPVR